MVSSIGENTVNAAGTVSHSTCRVRRIPRCSAFRSRRWSVVSRCMDSVDSYVPGVGVWFSDKQEGFITGTVRTRTENGDSVTLVFDRDDGGEHTATVKLNATDVSELPPMRNPPNLEATDDLTNLSYLNEPSVLQNLRVRYSQHYVYTYSGIVLIAMNPFARVPIYTSELVQAYSGKRRGELEPHLFAIGEEAYRGMITERHNQTVVISGESGAGKTVSAKFVMRYFAMAGEAGKKQAPGTVANAPNSDGFSETEERIMATNPILESFGNAKTTRNDNSSRFGKYIELHFNQDNAIVGAKIRVYLLERSRLVFQPATERNYHIFYQLCAGAPPSEREALKLQDQSFFRYTNQGGMGKINGVDDVEEFELTTKAMSTIGIPLQQQWDIFRILAGLLHLGNVEIKAQGANATITESDDAIVNACELLQVDRAALVKWIVNKQIIMRNEKIVSKLKPTDAVAVRDAMSKYIYSYLFDWFVKIINDVLLVGESKDGLFIGVLDIYGFEHFDKNSFEQFCINFANEKLQQEANSAPIVFKLEQEEYVREKISWSFIEFADNQACIDIIEGRLGVLSLLDEESRMPSGKDAGFLDKIHNQFGNAKHEQFYKKPRFSRTAFTICHYATDVTYESEGFLDKNKDTVPDEVLAVIMESKSEFLVSMIKTVQEQHKAAEPPAAANPPPGRPGPMRGGSGGASKKQTLGTVFKASLIELMATINATNVHYIRCLKPNQPKQAWLFEFDTVIGQLRACGVLETIKISSKGYPTKRTLPEFADRYRMLTPSSCWKDAIEDISPKIISSVGLTEDQYQIGQTKIFFRAGQACALARMEQMRNDKLKRAVSMIQKYMHGNTTRIFYKELRKRVIDIQQRYRAKLEFRCLRRERQEKAAVSIQKSWRMHNARREYVQERKKVVKTQAYVRGFQARKAVRTKQRDDAVISIQRIARGWITRREYQRTRKNVVFVQACLRRRIAKKQYKVLRAEAKSMTNVKYQLENKVVELTQQLRQRQSENKENSENISTLEGRIRSWKEKCKKLEDRNKELANKILNNSKEQQEALQFLLDEKNSLADRCASLTEKIAVMDGEFQRLNQDLAKKNEELQRAKEEGTTLANQRAETGYAGGAEEISSHAYSKASRRSSSLFMKSRAAGPITIIEETVNGNGRGPITPDEERTEMTELVPAADGVQKRATFGASSMGRGNRLEVRSKASRISYIMKNTSEGDREKLVSVLGSPGLEFEVINGLIKNLTVPVADLKNKFAAKEILFPSHMIGMVIAHMWSYGLTEPLKRILFNVLKSLQGQVDSFDGDYIFAFWFSNIMELLSILTNVETQMSRIDHPSSGEIRRVVGEIKNDFRSLAAKIYANWLNILIGRMGKLVVPAVLESQSLPGFVCNLQSSGSFFSKMMGNDTSDITVDAILNFFTKLWKIMKFYYLDDDIARNVILELLDNIAMTAFNQLLFRKNFCSWKRGMQIQYNITRVEEWCKTEKIQQTSDNLERLMEAAKLLQLQKKTAQDVDIMMEVCYMLNPTQIKKVLSIYAVSDYENPVSAEIMFEVGKREDPSAEAPLLLESRSRMENSAFALGRPVATVENYLPEWLELPKLRLIVQSSS